MSQLIGTAATAGGAALGGPIGGAAAGGLIGTLTGGIPGAVKGVTGGALTGYSVPSTATTFGQKLSSTLGLDSTEGKLKMASGLLGSLFTPQQLTTTESITPTTATSLRKWMGF